MPYLMKKDSAVRPLVFILIDSTDHISPKTGLSPLPEVQISKNGGAFAAPAGAVTELAYGWYKVAPDAGDSDTLGSLVLHASATGADPSDTFYEVVAFDPDDSAGLGLSRVDASISSRNATTPPTAPAIATQVWGETIPGSYTSSQAGYKLNAAGSSADPLLNAVPGSYASGSAGYALGRLVGSSITVNAPVLASGNVQIVRGDSYYAADGRALVWTLTGLPTINLTGAVTTFKAKNISSILTKTSSDTPGIRAVFSSGTLILTLELAAASTDALNVTTTSSPYDFDIQTLFSNGHVDTWVMGKMVVVADVR
jgi:hypothetical protein